MNGAPHSQPRRAAKPSKDPRSTPSANSATGLEEKARTDSANAVYDSVVRGGERRPDSDVFERLEQVDADVDTAVADNLDPEDLVAELEGTDSGEGADLAELDDLDEVSTEERELASALLPGGGGPFGKLAVGDDDGSVSPEELGEQFLRNAVQQDFHTATNDRESNDNVDLLTDAVHQTSLFDHNLDPLAEPRFPKVNADETRADADHTSSDTATAFKRAAARKARGQKSADADNSLTASERPVNPRKP
jgi:hypothetical protein